MYKEFYKLKQNPFSFTADPSVTFETKNFSKGFSHIIYGIEKMEGIITITGNIGTGKTTLCNYVAEKLRLDEKDYCIFISDPLFLENKIGNVFSLINQSESAENDLETPSQISPMGFRNLLENMAEKGKKTILIVDEADKLSIKMLQNLSFLSNIEKDGKKLVQIILVGEPTLNEKLNLKQLRQLNQRVSVRYQLKELDRKETQEYIDYRLKISGDNGFIQFVPLAIKNIYRYTGGCHRLINIVCDRALLRGMMEKTVTIDKSIIKHAIKSLHIDDKPKLSIFTFSFNHLYFSCPVFVILLAAGIYVAYPNNFLKKLVASAGLPTPVAKIAKKNTETKMKNKIHPSNNRENSLVLKKNIKKQEAIKNIVVIVRLARIRKLPTTRSKILTLVKFGTLLNMVEKKGIWIKVPLPEKDGYGWISNYLIKKLPS